MDLETVADHGELKKIVKQAIVEAIEEKKDVVHDIFIDALEDLAMIYAIREGENSGRASRKEVFDILEGRV